MQELLLLKGAKLCCLPTRGNASVCRSLGKTYIHQGTALTVLARLRRRSFVRGIHPVHREDKRFDPQAKLRGENHLQTPARFAIKDGTLWNAGSKHLLQTQGLGAELYQIAVGGFALAPFVLHRKRLRAKLNDVGAAREPQSLAFKH